MQFPVNIAYVLQTYSNDNNGRQFPLEAFVPPITPCSSSTGNIKHRLGARAAVCHSQAGASLNVLTRRYSGIDSFRSTTLAKTRQFIIGFNFRFEYFVAGLLSGSVHGRLPGRRRPPNWILRRRPERSRRKTVVGALQFKCAGTDA